MPKDAKLGLILGVGLVLLILVVFFRRDREEKDARPVQTAVAAEARKPVQLSPTSLAPAIQVSTTAHSQLPIVSGGPSETSNSND